MFPPKNWASPLTSKINYVIIINMAKQPLATGPITDPLKQAIDQSGKSLRSIEIATGVNRASLMRFMRGETSLRLDMADRLAEFFGLALQAVPQEKSTTKKRKVQ